MPEWMTKAEAGFQTSMHCSLRKVMLSAMPCREEKGREGPGQARSGV